jgi:hypothetical protein
VDAHAGLPDLKFAEARLLRNQADIGNAIKPYYGAAAGNRLTKLLRTHILEAVPVLVNAKAGNKPSSHGRSMPGTPTRTRSPASSAGPIPTHGHST